MPVKPQIALLPTLRAGAGISMRLYPEELSAALGRHGEVVVRLVEPPFGRTNHIGTWHSRWLRYVRYPHWCQSVRADLYHITDHANAQLLLALPPQCTVVTCHDLYPLAVARSALRYPGCESRAKLLPTALRLRLLRRAGAIVGISQHTLEECRRFLGTDRRRMFLAYYGIADEFRTPPPAERLVAFRRRQGLEEGVVHVLHVGSSDPRKNLGGVLRVVAALQSRLPQPVRLVRIGSAFSPVQQHEARALGIADQILHLGTLSTEELALAFHACQVLLYPSYHEGFCRPVAEAMACGLPVVCSNRGAIPELVEDSRLRFDPDDIEGMARCICELARSPQFAAEVADRGRRAAQRFTWAGHAEAVVEAYRFLLRPWR